MLIACLLPIMRIIVHAYRSLEPLVGDGHGLPVADIRMDPRVREQEWGIQGVSALSAVCARTSFCIMACVDPTQMPMIEAERTRVGRFFYRFPNGESGAGEPAWVSSPVLSDFSP